jgi:hypothetical protein
MVRRVLGGFFLLAFVAGLQAQERQTRIDVEHYVKQPKWIPPRQTEYSRSGSF